MKKVTAKNVKRVEMKPVPGTAPAPSRGTGSPEAGGNENVRHTCSSVVEFARSLSPNKMRMIDRVTLVQSQYPSCANINIKLVEDLSSKLVSPLIALEGEAKVFKNKAKTIEAFNKQGTDAYFLRVRPSVMSPMMYQLLEHIYTNLRSGNGVPPNMSVVDVDTFEERTFKSGYIYINKLSGAMVEYTSADEPARVAPMLRELDALAAREAQMAKLVVAPVVLYRGSCEVKVTFALKRVSVEKTFHATVIDATGNQVRLIMSESADDDERLRELGLVESAEEEDEEEAGPDPIFNV
ncbi:ssDNA-binding phosphoprotein [Equine molluscum contagiosum-like virus]|nr:ssDNA-binding phosphoprotein [Equine molluscum contagiosum-like virus]